MTTLLVHAYDRSQSATPVMEKLREAGFQDSHIECIEGAPESPDMFVRVPLSEDRGEILDAAQIRDLLREKGLSLDEIEPHIDALDQGRTLIIVASSDELSGRAEQILSGRAAESSIRRSSLDASSTDESTSTREVSSSQASPSPTQPPPSAAQEALVTSEARARYKIYEPDFRRHFEENYAALRRHSYHSYARAYRYGIALAIDSSYRRDRWPDVEPEARQQWNSVMNHPWEELREAARFGWYRVRGEEEKYTGRPRRL